jgi:hypothetical protein
MINKERRRERFLRDPLQVRLAGLAADLARIASSTRHEEGEESVALMIEESRYFIEWTAAEAQPEIAAELVDIQRMLTAWRKAWLAAHKDQTQRILLSIQAKKWSDQILGYQVT